MTELSSRRRPVHTSTVDPAVLAKALELAKGDHARLVLEKGGSVLVVNTPRRPK